MLERLLNISKRSSGPGSASADQPSSLPDHLDNADNADHADYRSSGFISLTDPNSHDAASMALAVQSSEDSDPEISFTEGFMFNLEGSGKLDGFDPGASADEDIFNWGLDGIHRSAATTNTTALPMAVPVVVPMAKESGPEHAGLEREVVKKRKPSRPDELPQGFKGSTATSQPTSTPASSPAAPIPESIVDHLLEMYFQQFRHCLRLWTNVRSAQACRAPRTTSLPVANLSFLPCLPPVRDSPTTPP